MDDWSVWPDDEGKADAYGVEEGADEGAGMAGLGSINGVEEVGTALKPP